MPRLGSKNLWKTLIFDDGTALFKVFLRFRGVENQRKNGPRTASIRNLAGRASWEAPGVDSGAIWGSFWVPKSAENGSENEPDFGSIFKRPKSATTPCDGGSAGLETDRRGGVGEGL